MIQRFLAGLLVTALSTASIAAQEGTAPWFEQEQLDLGRFVEGEVAEGEFQFRNPTGADQSIVSIKASCSCTSLVIFVGDERYTVEKNPAPNSIYHWTLDESTGRNNKQLVESIPVPEGAEGRVEVDIDLRNVRGRKSAAITFGLTDSENPAVAIQATAFAAQFFRLEPSEIRLEEMSFDEAREFTARVTSPVQPQFEITGMDPLPKGMTATYRKTEGPDGSAIWVVNGTYGPDIDPSAGGGVIRLRTNVQNRRVDVRVIAYVQGPLTVEPSSFIQFGKIKRAEGKTKTVRIVPAADFDLQIEDLTIEGSQLDEQYLEVTHEKVDGAIELTVTIKPDAPRSLVRGVIRLQLNHPAKREQTISFNGFVR